MTLVVNKYKDEYEVDISRKSKWGNPFSHQKNIMHVKKVATREEAIERYSFYVLGKIELISSLPELYQKKLGCTCKPLSCHGDILCELVEKYMSSDTEIEFDVFW